MRESFVLHSEYIEDLPEDYKSVFLMYAYNYGIKGEIPKLTGLEQSIWIKIQRRIDHDFETWEETKNSRSRGGKNHKGNQYTNKQTMEQNGTNGTDFQNTEQNGTEWNCSEQNGTNGTVYVSVSDNVSVNDNGDDDVNVGVPPEESPPPPPFLSEPQENYSRIIFDKFKNAGLPCQNGDFFRFQSCDFRLAIQKLKGYNSQDIISAVDNYIFELKNPESYKLQEYSFDNFIGTKTFSKCLPVNYRHNNFIEYRPQNKSGGQTQSAETKLHFYDPCLKCGQKLMEWKNDLQKYKCDSCGCEFTYEEVDSVREHFIVP